MDKSINLAWHFKY